MPPVPTPSATTPANADTAVRAAAASANSPSGRRRDGTGDDPADAESRARRLSIRLGLGLTAVFVAAGLWWVAEQTDTGPFARRIEDLRSRGVATSLAALDALFGKDRSPAARALEQAHETLSREHGRPDEWKESSLVERVLSDPISWRANGTAEERAALEARLTKLRPYHEGIRGALAAGDLRWPTCPKADGSCSGERGPAVTAALTDALTELRLRAAASPDPAERAASAGLLLELSRRLDPSTAFLGMIAVAGGRNGIELMRDGVEAGDVSAAAALAAFGDAPLPEPTALVRRAAHAEIANVATHVPEGWCDGTRRAPFRVCFGEAAKDAPSRWAGRVGILAEIAALPPQPLAEFREAVRGLVPGGEPASAQVPELLAAGLRTRDAMRRHGADGAVLFVEQVSDAAIRLRRREAVARAALAVRARFDAEGRWEQPADLLGAAARDPLTGAAIVQSSAGDVVVVGLAAGAPGMQGLRAIELADDPGEVAAVGEPGTASRLRWEFRLHD